MYFSRVRMRPGLSEISELTRILNNNSHGVHRLLWKLFPDQMQRSFLYREEIAREQLGVLPGVRGEPIYYLVSQNRPVVAENSIFEIETKAYQPRLEIGQSLNFECRVNPVIAKKGKKHDVLMNAQLTFLMSLIKGCNLEGSLADNLKKKDYKQILMYRGGDVLSRLLTKELTADPRYSDRLDQVSNLSDKLDWAIKGKIDTALGNWFKKQGKRCGFISAMDGYGLSKLQNTAYRWHALPEKAKNAGFSSVDLAGEIQVTDVELFKKALYCGIGRSKAFGCGLMIVQRV